MSLIEIRLTICYVPIRSRPHSFAQQIIQAALDRGAPDNVTVVVARYQIG